MGGDTDWINGGTGTSRCLLQLQMVQNGLNILLVDDDVTIHRVVAEFMRQSGNSLNAAENGETALELLRERTYDLMLVDLRMPGIGGMELVSRVRDAYPKMMVAVVSAYGELESVVEAMRMGAFDFVTKPFDLWDLEALLKRCRQQMESSEDAEGTG